MDDLLEFWLNLRYKIDISYEIFIEEEDDRLKPQNILQFDLS